MSAIHQWPNASGVKLDGATLQIWDSHQDGGDLICSTDIEASNYYELLTVYNDFDIICCVACWPEDDTEIWESQPWEVAYVMTFAGRGMEDVESGRLAELLVSHELADVFRIIDVDLDQFKGVAPQ